MRVTTTLIVDDSADFRARIKSILASEPGIAVVGEAADGADAVRQAEKLKPDLVVMDLRMPGTNGLEATRQMMASPPYPAVIIVTAFDMPEYRAAAIASGAVGLVAKTSMVDELLPIIRRLTRDPGALGPRSDGRCWRPAW